MREVIEDNRLDLHMTSRELALLKANSLVIPSSSEPGDRINGWLG